MDYIKKFEALSGTIEERLAHASHEQLAEIATEELSNFMRENDFDAQDFLSWSVSAETLPYQGWDFDFGEPAITVARTENLRIDLLYWMHKAAPVHDHVTCGSFGALIGDRLHSRYEFTAAPGEDTDGAITLGNLEATDLRLMREREAEPILPELIHDIYWIDTPSVTIVVRCNEHPGIVRRPADYYAPGVRIVDPMRLKDSLVKRRNEAMELLSLADPVAYEKALVNVFTSGSPEQQVQSYIQGAEENEEVLLAVMENVHSSELLKKLSSGRETYERRALFSGVYNGEDEQVQLLAALLWAGANNEQTLKIFLERFGEGTTQDHIDEALIRLADMDESLQDFLGTPKELVA